MALARFTGPLTDFGLGTIDTTGLEVSFTPNDTGATAAGRMLLKDPIKATIADGKYIVDLHTTDDIFPIGAHYTLRVKRLSVVLFDRPDWKLYAPAGGGSLIDMLAPPTTNRTFSELDARYVRRGELAAAVAAAIAADPTIKLAVTAAVAAEIDGLDLVVGDDSRLPERTRPEVHPWGLADAFDRAAMMLESDGAVQLGGGWFIPLPPETGYVCAYMDWARRTPFAVTVDGTVDLNPSAATIAALGGGRADPRDTGSDLVLVLGQSNGQGAGVPFDSTIDILTSGINQYAGSGSQENLVIPAIESLWHVSRWIDGTNGLPRVGPAMEFARQYFYTQSSNRDVLIVPAAQGSTSISGNANYSWDPDNTTATTNLIRRAITKTQQALALNPNNRLVAILWHQGESDVGSLTESQYRAKLLQIIDLLRSNFGATVPFLVGGLVPEWVAANSARAPIQAALASIPSQRNYTAYTAGPSGMNQDATIHYSAAGARELGRRYFAALPRARANN